MQATHTTAMKRVRFTVIGSYYVFLKQFFPKKSIYHRKSFADQADILSKCPYLHPMRWTPRAIDGVELMGSVAAI